MNMMVLIFFLVLGFSAGFWRVLPDRLYDVLETFTLGSLMVLLATMGARIGVNEEIVSQLDIIGLQALLLAAGSITGSVILVKIVVHGLHITAGESENIEQPGDGPANRIMTFLIIVSVVTGIVAGLYLIPYSRLELLESITGYVLALIFLGVGMDIGRKKETFIKLREIGWLVLLIPPVIALGSIFGALLPGYLLGLAGREAAAVGAGFGWYSLSGVILAEMHSVELGSLAFLSNVFREFLSIIILPFVVKYLGNMTGIAPGGATTMDVTLPVVKETAGDEVVIPAFISGVILTALVPVLVPFIINLG